MGGLWPPSPYILELELLNALITLLANPEHCMEIVKGFNELKFQTALNLLVVLAVIKWLFSS